MNAIRQVLAGLALVAITAFTVTAQERLIDQEPHDLLTIPFEKGIATLKVYPLKFRRMPKDPKPTEKIQDIKLIEDEDNRTFEVIWQNVKKIEFFEDRVLDEAETLAAAGKLDDAYANYAFLLKKYPDTQRLDESIQSYWYLSALASIREKRYEEALSVLEDLLRKNPNYNHSDGSPSLINLLGGTCDRLVQRYLDNSDFRSASRLIGRITTAYPDAKQEPFYAKFQAFMQNAAEKKRDEARAHLEAKRFTEAYDATAAMLDILPSVSGGRELAAEINKQYPLAVVAVDVLATAPNVLGLDNWADQRVGRLTDRRLMELRGIGPEGGDYATPLGTCERSEDLQSLSITLSPNAAFTTYDLLQLVLAGARRDSPLFSPGWAQTLGSARIVRPGQVEATLRRPHLLPQALLTLPLGGASNSEGKGWSGNYQIADASDTQSRYVLPPETMAAGKPREIQERAYTSPEAAILALQRGEVDAIDRVQPADMPVVRAIPGVKLVRYAVPTIHVLVPNPNRPWPANRTFRRAVMYALQRDAILKQGILRTEDKVEGAQLISGPLPAPINSGDPLSYTYDDKIQPHAYDPLLAVILLDLAKRELDSTARLKEEQPPKFEGVVLGHPPQELPTIVCKAMSKQLAALNIPCRTVELASPESRAQCDFVYAELLIAEPVVDLVRLLGPDGLYPATNPYVRQGIRQVEKATTWNQAGQGLKQLHRVLHEDLTLLPLWQTPEHFAVQKNLQGVGAAPISLYQDIEQWRLTPRLGQN
jgi:tetratricopeptide (TPR) repeat protein